MEYETGNIGVIGRIEYATADKFEETKKELYNKIIKNETDHRRLELRNNNEHTIFRIKQQHAKLRIDNLYDIVMDIKTKQIEELKKEVESLRIELVFVILGFMFAFCLLLR